ncbi:hypothetical protein AVEN_7304-1 [Araneus ventricosus]|uniref:Uncharacterized protein n=1 Tax=Araneus ventricosus TaxID=182803 RepID=A0A4Y2RXF2_ARAVE|nr:hypothetical protein AVEN_7304-1 [Araneus ventricosus]
MSLLLVPYIIIASLNCILASNSNETEHRTPLHFQFSRRPAGSIVKGLPGLESVLGGWGSACLSSYGLLPFVAPAAAALLPLASLSNMFGRRRRHLDDPKDMYPETEALLRRIHAAAIRRNVH